MLSRLYIQNYALIDTLDINFGPGLTIITGETGAGKSIILGALSLILGQRADSKQLFDSGKKCIIEGIFDISTHQLHHFFQQYDLDYQDETVIRREFSADGKSRAFINDTPVTLHILKAFSERLIDIHSQHATLQVADPEFQLQVLDSVAGNDSLRKDFASKLHAFKLAKKDLEELIARAERNAAEADYKQFLFDELEAAQLKPGEAQGLEEEQTQLSHAEEIQSGLAGAVSLLIEQEGHAESLMREALQMLSKSSTYMTQLEEPESRLKSCLIELKDLAGELEVLANTVHIDEERLEYIHERLGLIYTLQQKHRVNDSDELIHKFEEISQELQISSQDEMLIEETKLHCANLQEDLASLAALLHQARQQVLPVVSKQILAILANVGMPDSKLDIRLEPLEFSAYRADGGDGIQFLFSSNKGQAAQAVGKVASGGELSRLMLAIKSVVAAHSALPTIIFDEIDTGISGEVALRVGDVLAQMGDKMQVITITHLPQIASRGHMHYRVYKAEEANRTQSKMELLKPEGRALEIAQMLSGADPGPAARAHAKALLGR